MRQPKESERCATCGAFKCQHCPACGAHAKIYKIKDKPMCSYCGTQEIKKWNALVNH
jgi:hypothetical protein